MSNPANLNTALWLRQRDLFEAACALPAAEQAAFVNAQAADSPELAQSLLRMLAAHTRFSGQTDNAHAQLLQQVDALQSDDELSSKLATDAQIGAFRLIYEIGRGGMGVVWKASRIDDVAQTVAIKLLPPHRWDLASRARFQAERDALARLEHPGIARLIDAGTFKMLGQTEDVPFYVMEYVEGVSITDYATAQNLSTHERVRLFVQVLDAVDYAHRMLLIHRDLKPSNILVNASGQVKLIDFGIVKNLSALSPNVQTGTQQRFFSPSFAAPEQLRGLANSVAVDVYQLGAVLYELLSAKPVFDLHDASASEVERSILARVPTAPSRISTRPRSGIDADLDAVCLHCLRKEPGLRYASVAALQEDLRRTLGHRGISIRQGQGLYRAAKFLRRNALGVGFVVIVLGLVLGFSWKSWQQAQHMQQQAIAVQHRAQQETQLAKFLVKLLQSADPYSQGTAEISVTSLLNRAAGLLEANQKTLSPESETRIRIELASIAVRLNKSALTASLIKTIDAKLAAGLDADSNAKFFETKAMLNIDDSTHAPIETEQFLNNYRDELSAETSLSMRLLLERQRSQHGKSDVASREQLLVDARKFGANSSEYTEALIAVLNSYAIERNYSRVKSLFAEGASNFVGPTRQFALAEILLLRGTVELDHDPELAITYASEAESIYRKITGNGSKGVLTSMSARAVALRKSGKFDAARLVYSASISEARSLKDFDELVVAKLLFNLSILEAGLKHWNEAAAHAAEAATIARDGDSDNTCSFSLWAAEFSFNADQISESRRWAASIEHCDHSSYDRAAKLQLDIRLIAKSDRVRAKFQLNTVLASEEFRAFPAEYQQEFRTLSAKISGGQQL